MIKGIVKNGIILIYTGSNTILQIGPCEKEESTCYPLLKRIEDLGYKIIAPDTLVDWNQS